MIIIGYLLYVCFQDRKILLKFYSREGGGRINGGEEKSEKKFFLVLEKWKIFLGHNSP